MKIEQFVKDINGLRKKLKNQWYYWQGIVDGKNVSLKGFNTWIQRIQIDNIKAGSPMKQSVRQFNAYLHNVVK